MEFEFDEMDEIELKVGLIGLEIDCLVFLVLIFVVMVDGCLD